MNNLIEKLKRNWYLYAGASLLFVAPHIQSALAETIVHYVGIMFLVTATANLLIHGFTKIAWRDWKDNSEFEIVGKCIVIAAVFFGCAFVAGQMFNEENKTASISQFNEEIQIQDSLHVAK